MNSMDQVRLFRHEHTTPTGTDSSVRVAHHRLAAPLRSAVLGGRQWLLAQQQEDGHWVGELEGDSILESEFILLLAYLGRENSPLAAAAARYLIDQQLPTGGWSQVPDGDVDISASVKAYFALKVVGHDPSEEYMCRARSAILAEGGADRVNSFTRFYLALLGQLDYDCCPAVPPEMILLPRWLPINLSRVSAWSRTIIVPLSIIWAHRPARKLSAEKGIRELFLSAPEQWPPPICPGKPTNPPLLSWGKFFRGVDRVVQTLERIGLTPWRNRALREAELWMRERCEDSDGLGAIFPPIVWSVVAFDCLGYSAESAEMKSALRQLFDLVITDETDDTARLQPCKSPVWDTAMSLKALSDSGIDSSEESCRTAVSWLLQREIRRRGDWADNTTVEPSGWCFEYNNPYYPDNDDTAMVLIALGSQVADAQSPNTALPPGLSVVGDAERPAGTPPTAAVDGNQISAAARRATRWLVAMQNNDGGWGAFDRNNDAEFLCHVPFADHNAMIDPSTPDLTGRVLEALGIWGFQLGQPAIDRAVAYLRQTQQADGSWFGRWGVNYLYGTWQVLTGLIAAGVSPDDPAVAAGVNWLVAHQQPSGGWGESVDSYLDPRKRGQGVPTPSQTAWALLGLIVAGKERHPAVAHGIRFLIDSQQDDGSWNEPEFTGTGFPQVFYLRYHYYRNYFPLMALSRWAAVVDSTIGEFDRAVLRLVHAPADDKPRIVASAGHRLCE